MAPVLNEPPGSLMGSLFQPWAPWPKAQESLLWRCFCCWGVCWTREKLREEAASLCSRCPERRALPLLPWAPIRCASALHSSEAPPQPSCPPPPVLVERDLCREPHWAPLPGNGQPRRKNPGALSPGSPGACSEKCHGHVSLDRMDLHTGLCLEWAIPRPSAAPLVGLGNQSVWPLPSLHHSNTPHLPGPER